MRSEFDPYDLLMEALERLSYLENKHNQLAHAFQETEREFNLALQSIKHLQQSQLVVLSNQTKMEKRLQELESLTK